MKFVADLHIHSHYSRATSRDLTFEQLHKWAQLKGVQVVGSGDLTHPGWLNEMREKLEPAEPGLFRLKAEYAAAAQAQVFPACRQPVRFLLSGEISTIYKKHDRTRKVHHVIALPSLDAVEKFQRTLEKIGNIRSDGRPILGLDSHDLLETVLGIDPQAYLIPAHIWTPWFSLFGSKSGFDAIEDCFEELTPHIFAVETGLSSDPPMNWRLSALDRYTLISDSDAHSPQKLAREANLFDTDLSYPAMFAALKREDPAGFLGTLEFFPEEGKYHADGHRKCNLRWDPQTTLQHNGLCAVCGKPVTVGVGHRVETLADRADGYRPETARPFESLIPLPEILSEISGVGVGSKRVAQGYDLLLAGLGSELAILRELPFDDIRRAGGDMLAEGIRRMRAGEVIAEAGYDGEFGVITLFAQSERANARGQMGFLSPKAATSPPGMVQGVFAAQPPEIPSQKAGLLNSGKMFPSTRSGNDTSPFPERVEGNTAADFFGGCAANVPTPGGLPAEQSGPALLQGLNPEQREAAAWTATSLMIAAGPGTGKTRALTHRMAYLIQEQVAAPEQMLALTFTNKAAEEMTARLRALLGDAIADRLTISTCHALCAMILRDQNARIDLPPTFTICSEPDRKIVLKHALPDAGDHDRNAWLDAISDAKNRLLTPADTLGGSADQREFADVYQRYDQMLRAYHAVDFDDLPLLTVRLFETHPDVVAQYHARFRWIAVDEYQDSNLAQYRLLRLLNTPAANLCVIGDPDQAIYGFRGADRAYFLQFRQDFPDARVLHLTQNYRSTQMIVSAARQVIAKSAERLPSELWTEVVSATKLDIYPAATDKAEAEYVVHEIEKMVGGTTHFSLDSGRVASHADSPYAFGDFAVLYRLGAQRHALQDALRRSGIPYQIVGQRSLCEYADAREMLAYLRLAHNPAATFHLALITAPEDAAWSLIQELHLALGLRPVTHLLERVREFVGSGRQRASANIADAADDTADGRFERLCQRAMPFGCDLGGFLESTALRKDIDDYDPRADRVAVMTLHASKGLEFPVVFITGCEETLLPYMREGRRCDLEEERRLLYVGMTRAQHKLVLTYAHKRFLFGETRRNLPSRFITDIEAAVKELQVRSRPKTAPKPEDSQLRLF